MTRFARQLWLRRGASSRDSGGGGGGMGMRVGATRSERRSTGPPLPPAIRVFSWCVFDESDEDRHDDDDPFLREGCKIFRSSLVRVLYLQKCCRWEDEKDQDLIHPMILLQQSNRGSLFWGPNVDSLGVRSESVQYLSMSTTDVPCVVQVRSGVLRGGNRIDPSSSFLMLKAAGHKRTFHNLGARPPMKVFDFSFWKMRACRIRNAACPGVSYDII